MNRACIENSQQMTNRHALLNSNQGIQRVSANSSSVRVNFLTLLLVSPKSSYRWSANHLLFESVKDDNILYILSIDIIASIIIAFLRQRYIFILKFARKMQFFFLFPLPFQNNCVYLSRQTEMMPFRLQRNQGDGHIMIRRLLGALV